MIAFNNFVESGLENPITEIFVINSDSTGLTKLTNNTKWNTGPSICDNGERIAFRGSSKTEKEFDNDLFIVNCLSEPEDENGAELTFSTAIIIGSTLPIFVGVMIIVYRKTKKPWEL